MMLSVKRTAGRAVVVWLLCCLWGAVGLVAQTKQYESVEEGYNPFELLYKLDEREQAAIRPTTAEDPFALDPPAALLLHQIKESNKYKGEFIVEVSRFEDDRAAPKVWLLVLVLPAFLLLVLVGVFFRQKLDLLYGTVTNNNMMALAYREARGRPNVHFVLLDMFSVLSFAFFGLVLVLDDYVNTENFSKAVIVAFSLSLGYLFCQRFLRHFVKAVFDEQRRLSPYLFALRQYNHFLSISLLFMGLFVAYAPQAFRPFVLWAALGAVAFWWMLRLYRSIGTALSYATKHILRFFAYLCTVEIAPMVVLWTTIRSILGH